MLLPTPTPGPSQPNKRPLLRRADQAVVASLLAVSLAVMAGYLIRQGALRGRMIEVEEAPPQNLAFQVDINRADWVELAHLPDIGETLARRIVENREANGPFQDHSQLRRVRGVGPKTLERLKPYLAPLAPAETVVGN